MSWPEAYGLPLAIVLMGMYLREECPDKNDRKGIIAAMSKLYSASVLLKEREAEAGNKATRTLEEIIELSYKALKDSADRSALARLSIFRSKPSSFTDEMAQEICDVAPERIRNLLRMGLIEVKDDNEFTIHPIITAHARTKLSEDLRLQLYANTRDWYGRKLSKIIDNDPDSYQDWYRYEKADWQATKDSWLYYLAASGDRSSLYAFLRVFFDAFWWWGYYQRFPFCERLIREWQIRDLGRMQREGLALLLEFHEAYPEGYVKVGHTERWLRTERALTAIRQGLGLDGEYADIPTADARRVRSFLDFFGAECLGYGRQDHAAALQRYQSSHDQFVQDGVQWVPAWIWFYVGQYMLDFDDRAAAQKYTRAALGEAGENVPLCKRDPELLANIYRVLGDLYLDAGDATSAALEYGRAAFYAFVFQAIPESADTYTVEFYREITGRISGRLAKEVTSNDGQAVEVGRVLHALFVPWWAQHGGANSAAAASALYGGEARLIEGALFPAVPSRDSVLGEGVSAAFKRHVEDVLSDLRSTAQVLDDPPEADPCASE